MDGPSEVEGQRSRFRQGFRCMSPSYTFGLRHTSPCRYSPSDKALSSHLAGDSKGALNSISFHSTVFSNLRCWSLKPSCFKTQLHNHPATAYTLCDSWSSHTCDSFLSNFPSHLLCCTVYFMANSGWCEDATQLGQPSLFSWRSIVPFKILELVKFEMLCKNQHWLFIRDLFAIIVNLIAGNLLLIFILNFPFIRIEVYGHICNVPRTIRRTSIYIVTTLVCLAWNLKDFSKH